MLLNGFERPYQTGFSKEEIEPKRERGAVQEEGTAERSSQSEAGSESRVLIGLEKPKRHIDWICFILPRH